MAHSLYRFSDVEAQNPRKDTIREAIASVLRAHNDACYVDMEPHLIPPGESGSKYFDQAYAVGILLEHDRNGEGRISKIMAETPTLKRRYLWDELQKVLRAAGFKMRHGRLAGLIEDRSKPESEQQEDDGQPDID